jgi:uncharacterized protein (DUF2252 family)
MILFFQRRIVMNSVQSIVRATRDYEAWLARQVRVVRVDLRAKHRLMAEDGFSFLRATFYRWSQLLPALCPKLASAPKVLGVGDLRVENYGTWRDAEGRLVWGINDFDEACPLPYTNDLVRLATSVWLAIEADDLALGRGPACTVILEGYAAGLESGGRPVVLSERNRWLRDAVTSRLRDPAKFWQKLAAQPVVRDVPTEVRALLEGALPELRSELRTVHRRSGLGSLGRPRFTALAEWRGGKVAREAKPLLPSAWLWAAGAAGDTRIYYDECVRHAVRAYDPFLQMQDAWILRRLSPYCSRIELRQMPRWRDEQKLLWKMGYELANVHLGTHGARTRIRADLHRHKPKWLRQSAETMAEATLADWKEWKRKTA